MESQEKYRNLISYIKILSNRAEKETSERLRKIAKYLEKVSEQRHLAMILETDRIEKTRYKELLEYIDKNYDETIASVKEICKTLDKREDMEEVLKYYDKKDNKPKEEEEIQR